MTLHVKTGMFNTTCAVTYGEVLPELTTIFRREERRIDRWSGLFRVMVCSGGGKIEARTVWFASMSRSVFRAGSPIAEQR